MFGILDELVVLYLTRRGWNLQRIGLERDDVVEKDERYTLRCRKLGCCFPSDVGMPDDTNERARPGREGFVSKMLLD